MASAARATGHPCTRTRSTSAALPMGVSFALAWATRASSRSESQPQPCRRLSLCQQPSWELHLALHPRRHRRRGRDDRSGPAGDPPRGPGEQGEVDLPGLVARPRRRHRRDPLAGLAAYVAAHAIEYIVVVERTMLKRYGGGSDRSPFLGRVARSTSSRLAFLALVMGAFFAMDARLDGTGSRHLYDIAFYTMGMLHFWYDGFIWKLRKPAVAATSRCGDGVLGSWHGRLGGPVAADGWRRVRSRRNRQRARRGAGHAPGPRGLLPAQGGRELRD